MNVQINGKLLVLPKQISLLAWIGNQNIPLAAVIVEYNGEILSRDHWETTLLNEGDQVELLQFVGGGR
ncbi:sulfur carrier protein ThiS [Desulfitobacterium sp. Sab5]|uniref:sulfur carrier protein ThiS n=1 Tax=Desulfitobacterium TaxID=36853 RepID=UPI003CE9C244